ncbi:MAG: hypothetical protein ACHP65_10060 [Legionellales bacterium]
MRKQDNDMLVPIGAESKTDIIANDLITNLLEEIAGIFAKKNEPGLAFVRVVNLIRWMSDTDIKDKAPFLKKELPALLHQVIYQATQSKQLTIDETITMCTLLSKSLQTDEDRYAIRVLSEKIDLRKLGPIDEVGKILLIVKEIATHRSEQVGTARTDNMTKTKLHGMTHDLCIKTTQNSVPQSVFTSVANISAWVHQTDSKKYEQLPLLTLALAVIYQGVVTNKVTDNDIISWFKTDHMAKKLPFFNLIIKKIDWDKLNHVDGIESLLLKVNSLNSLDVFSDASAASDVLESPVSASMFEMDLRNMSSKDESEQLAADSVRNAPKVHQPNYSLEKLRSVDKAESACASLSTSSSLYPYPTASSSPFISEPSVLTSLSNLQRLSDRAHMLSASDHGLFANASSKLSPAAVKQSSITMLLSNLIKCLTTQSVTDQDRLVITRLQCVSDWVSSTDKTQQPLYFNKTLILIESICRAGVSQDDSIACAATATVNDNSLDQFNRLKLQYKLHFDRTHQCNSEVLEFIFDKDSIFDVIEEMKPLHEQDSALAYRSTPG